MKKFRVAFLFLFGFLMIGNLLFASPSDSLDVRHTIIRIDSVPVLGGSSGELYGHTTLDIDIIQNNVSTLRLDLLHLSPDSIRVDGLPAAFSYNDTLLIIQLASPRNSGDSATVDIWYNGVPKKDNSGFGGFYFQFSGQYIYNIGVGFNADPHTYGRVWYPCKDNFTDRSTYEFFITTDSSQMAVCNGLLQSMTSSGTTKTWHWTLEDPIPSYLVSMAISDYVVWRDQHVTQLGDTIPVEVYVRPGDSSRVPGSFARLLNTLQEFENRFGPYRWDRVGYVIVPFNGGAMEHSTNIAYPLFAVNGGTTYETLWAHELSHQWFGDLVTCEYQEDMWLNEGFAAYCEAIHEEVSYGTQAYKDYVRENHQEVLRYTHIRDGGYRAVSGIPHDYTYGSTVYDKGALVAHTLRWYMGDSTFWDGIQHYTAQKAFNHANSDTLKTYLENGSGDTLDSFFDGWVYQPGFPHFRVDSMKIHPVGPAFYAAQVFLRQQLKGANQFVDDWRFTLDFVAPDGSRQTEIARGSGEYQMLTFSLNFEPVAVWIDAEEHMADATTDNYKKLFSNGYYEFDNAYCNWTVDQAVDTAWVQVTHHWVAPDSFFAPRPGIKLSDTRYWTLSGLVPQGFNAAVDFEYNGQTNSAVGFLDNSWLTNREDSLILFWRSGPGMDWQEAEHYNLNNIGSGLDRRGRVTLDSLKLGDYALGLYEGFVSREEEPAEPLAIRVFPNPAKDRLQVQAPGLQGNWNWQILDLQGRTLLNGSATGPQSSIDLSVLAGGIYFLQVRQSQNGSVQNIKFQVR